MLQRELAAMAARQQGLFTRAQAEAFHTEREIRTRTRTAGPWVTVRRGVYCERELWEALDQYDEPGRLRDVAAHLMMHKEHVLSHDSAARLQGLPFFRPTLELSHVTRPGVGGSRTDHGVKHHLARLRPEGLAEIEALPVTGLARTAVDLAREHGRRTGLTACDAVLRRGVPRSDLRDELELMTSWPHVVRARWCVDHADDGAETVGESLTRDLLLEAGFTLPETQFPVRTDRGVMWCDLRVGCHVFEFDGRVKYRRAGAGGVAERPVDEVLWDEKLRQDAICGVGLGMSRVVWEDLLGRSRERTKVRLRAEYDRSLRAFGAQLPEHLARFAQETKGRRAA